MMAAKCVSLHWEGKRAAQVPTSPPALRCMEKHGPANEDGWRNRLIQGDNLEAMAALRGECEGKFALIYLDPPFFTGSDFNVTTSAKEGSLATSSHAYTDKWGGDLGAYLQWMLDRLTAARHLLREDGCIYVHLSWHAAHYVKLLMDEVFGIERFQNEIIWCYREAINSKKRWNRKHDTILFYSKGKQFTFNYDAVRQPYAESNIRKYRHKDEKGVYRLMGRGIVNSPLRSKRDLPPEYEEQYPGLTYRHYLGTGTLPLDYWHIDIENQASSRRTGYPTQKPEALLERILSASSNSNDLIGDFCCGSGTTLAVAQRLSRRWVGCDVGEIAIELSCRRLSSDILAGFQVEKQGDKSESGEE
jgi:adenine specific DNA methylase Mod